LGETDKSHFRSYVDQANFFKHADRDPYTRFTFYEESITYILLIACRNLESVATDLPLEAQIFLLWQGARFKRVSDMPLRTQDYFRRSIRLFPGIRRAADLVEQRKIGLTVLKEALANPVLQEKS
jgi:hypothetical protein